MSAYPFTYQKDDFSPAITHDAELHIMANKREMAFAITANGELLAWKDKVEIEKLANDSELVHILTSPFKSVAIGLIPETLTLIPAALYDEGRIADYARYLDVKADDKVLSANLNTDNQLIYKVSAAVIDALGAKFDLKKFVPAHRGWLKLITDHQTDNNSLFADVMFNSSTFLYVKDGQITYYNSIYTGDIDDVLYYALFISNQLELKQDSVKLFVSGSLSENDTEKLKGFFSNVHYNTSNPLAHIADIAPHQLLSIAALA